MWEKLDHFVIPALGQLHFEVSTCSDIETQLLAPILTREANEHARRCIDVTRRQIEQAVALELRQYLPRRQSPESHRRQPRQPLPPHLLGGFPSNYR